MKDTFDHLSVANITVNELQFREVPTDNMSIVTEIIMPNPVDKCRNNPKFLIKLVFLFYVGFSNV
ncbi:MAG: hypothetical protein ACW97Z_09550 [Candidatus Hodarchaeales archaeon]